MKVFYAYLVSELIEEVDDDLLYEVVSMIGEQNWSMQLVNCNYQTINLILQTCASWSFRSGNDKDINYVRYHNKTSGKSVEGQSGGGHQPQNVPILIHRAEKVRTSLRSARYLPSLALFVTVHSQGGSLTHSKNIADMLRIFS